VTPTRNLSAPPAGTVCCAVVAHATLRARADAVPALRQTPGPAVGEPLPPSFLKHADEQTVVGLAAVFRAIHDHGLAGTRFTDWGVVAASRFLGRATLAVALQRFALEGAWGVSPHLIPHRSLHSVSGTVSQALHIHGPNFGVGGGPGGTSEAMLVAASLVAQNRLPGLWVVLTGWDAEPVLDLQGTPPLNGNRSSDKVCSAVALALTAGRPGGPGLRLHVGPEAGQRGNGRPPSPFFSLEAFLGVLADPAGSGGPGAWRLECGGRVHLERAGAGAENGW
jgi:hypothetical protein